MDVEQLEATQGLTGARGMFAPFCVCETGAPVCTQLLRATQFARVTSAIVTGLCRAKGRKHRLQLLVRGQAPMTRGLVGPSWNSLWIRLLGLQQQVVTDGVA